MRLRWQRPARSARRVSSAWRLEPPARRRRPPSVRLWLEFGARPTARNWYRAHNASIVGGYLGHRELADAESAPERFFMNVVLVRVLYAHTLVAAPRLALGDLAFLGRVLGDPRLGMAGVFLSLSRVLPNRYPLGDDVERYTGEEQRLGRVLDYAVIAPRAQRLYEWSAGELAEPRLLELIQDGNLVYAWPVEKGDVWRAHSRSRPAPSLASLARRARRRERLRTPRRHRSRHRDPRRFEPASPCRRGRPRSCQRECRYSPRSHGPEHEGCRWL